LSTLNQKSFKNFKQSLDATDFSLWRVAKATCKPPSYVPPMRMCNGKWARDEEGKAVASARLLHSTFQLNSIALEVIPDIKLEGEDMKIKLYSPSE